MQGPLLIYPTIGEIMLSTSLSRDCSECYRTFANSNALRMHMIKTHNIIKSDSDLRMKHRTENTQKNVDKRFFCPSKCCRYNKQNYFKSFKLVRQHFLKVHQEKKLICSKCNMAKFSLKRDLDYHERRKCGYILDKDSLPSAASNDKILTFTRPDDEQKDLRKEIELIKENLRIMQSEFQHIVHLLNELHATFISRSDVPNLKKQVSVGSQADSSVNNFLFDLEASPQTNSKETTSISTQFPVLSLDSTSCSREIGNTSTLLVSSLKDLDEMVPTNSCHVSSQASLPHIDSFTRPLYYKQIDAYCQVSTPNTDSGTQIFPSDFFFDPMNPYNNEGTDPCTDSLPPETCDNAFGYNEVWKHMETQTSFTGNDALTQTYSGSIDSACMTERFF